MSSDTAIARTFARARVPLGLLGLFIIVGNAVWGLVDRETNAPILAMAWLLPTGLIAITFGSLMTVLGPAAGGHFATLSSPVKGRWIAFNSPWEKVPSHGTHGFGQSYAVDLLFAGEAPSSINTPMATNASRSTNVGSGGAFRASEEYPSFGLPIFSPADAVVVEAVSTIRDHRARVGALGMLYFHIESVWRQIWGSRGMFGNYVVLRLGDGSHFVLAHLQNGSVTVEPGEKVSRGQKIASCGNSGNSTEPHLHCQRQDIARSSFAMGLPWTIEPGGIPMVGDVSR